MLEAHVETSAASYSIHSYALEKSVLEDLQRLALWRSFGALALAWGACALLARAFLAFGAPWLLYPIFALLMAGRQGVFLQIMHEAAHRLLSKNPRLNNALATWLAAAPLGLNFAAYSRNHLNHHAHTNEAEDSPTDVEKYLFCDVRSPRLWRLFMKDLVGITAFQILFQYEKVGIAASSRGVASKLSRLTSTGVVQIAILWTFFDGHVLYYLALWLAPLVAIHMPLMRVRGIAEHGLPAQRGLSLPVSPPLGTLYTRSFLTSVRRYDLALLNWIEKILIGSLNVHYHHEHHLLPTVPFYNLPRLHLLIAERALQCNPNVYAKGYFWSLFYKRR